MGQPTTALQCRCGIDMHAHVVPAEFPPVDAPTLRHLQASLGTPALLIGTDHPFNFHEPHPMARLAEAGFDAATQRAVGFGNARRFLGPRAATALKTLENA